MPTSARIHNGAMWASSPTAVNYIQLQIIIFVGTFTPDGPCEINHKRTVEDACPYGGIIIYIPINYNLLKNKGVKTPLQNIKH